MAVLARRAVAAALRTGGDGGYDIVVEDINKLPLFLPSLTSLPFCAIVPHLFGTTAFAEVSWPVAATVWIAERLIPRVYRTAGVHVISQSPRGGLVAPRIRPGQIAVLYPGIAGSWYAPGPATARLPRATFLDVGRLRRY